MNAKSQPKRSWVLKVTIHQTHHTIGDFDAIEKYLKENITKQSEGLHIFPELFLTGYPLQDLCLQKAFIVKYHGLLDRLKKWSKKSVNQEKCCLLMGGLKYELSPKKSLPVFIENVVYQIGQGKDFENIYTKQLLPNYDIFDEKKYFKKGKETLITEFFGVKTGVLICEDMWTSLFHEKDPVQSLHAESIGNDNPLDLVINLSGSPFHLNKHKKRLERAGEISHLLECPFVYVNRVGAEDEIIFDGGSFVLNGQDVLAESKRFVQDQITWDFNLSLKNRIMYHNYNIWLNK